MAPRKRRKPNTGTVRFKPGRARPWETTFKLGPRDERCDYFVSAAEAHAHLDRLVRERDDAVNPRNIAGGSMGLHPYLALWLEIKKPLIKAKTYIDYEYQCKLAVEYLTANRRIDSIGRKDAQLLYNYWHGRGYKNVSQLRTVLAQAWDYAEDEDYVHGNPFRRAQAPSVERARRIALTKIQRAALLDYVKGADLEALWHLYARMGLRRGEGIGLLWANIDWEAQTITIEQQYTNASGRVIKETPKTKRSRRTFPIPDDILAMLRALQRAQTARAAADRAWEMSGLVFTNAHGRRLNGDAVYRRWARMRAALKLPESVTVHDLRHTALYHMEIVGIPESVRMAFAGHSSPAMARKYADHASEDIETLRAALKRMGA